MKNNGFIFLLAILCAGMFFSCSLFEKDDEEDDTAAAEATVTFIDAEHPTEDGEPFSHTCTLALDETTSTNKFMFQATDPRPVNPAASSTKSFAGWYTGETGGTLYNAADFAAGFTPGEYTFYARYNDIESAYDEHKILVVVYNATTGTMIPNVVYKSKYADYANTSVLGIEVAADNGTYTLLGVQVKELVKWWYANDFIPVDFSATVSDSSGGTISIDNILLNVDHSGNDNYAIIAKVFGKDTIDTLNWAENYNATYDIPTALNLSWYVPSVIEFENYVANRITDYVKLIFSLGGVSSQNTMDFWTASLIGFPDTIYKACYYSSKSKSITYTEPTAEKYALALCTWEGN